MPIRPENRAYYRSAHWRGQKAIVQARAQGRCEMCGVENGGVALGGGKVVLTVAHMDHNDFTATADRMQHLCQACHNRLDAPHRAKQAAVTRRARRAKWQTELFAEEKQ